MNSLQTVQIQPYSAQFQDDVLNLIVTIQQKEFGINITAADQPDLMDIEGFYQQNRGNFWVAVHEQQVVGTISLLDIGEEKAALRKMFVKKEKRGKILDIASRLLNTLLEWSRSNRIHTIYLGTTPQFLAAHRFYEKNGFTRIEKKELPERFPVMIVDTRFYRLTL